MNKIAGYHALDQAQILVKAVVDDFGDSLIEEDTMSQWG